MKKTVQIFGLLIINYGIKFLLSSMCTVSNINILQPNTYFTYQQRQHSEILCSAHTVFTGFVWISEQTVIIYLYSIKF